MTIAELMTELRAIREKESSELPVYRWGPLGAEHFEDDCMRIEASLEGPIDIETGERELYPRGLVI